LVVTVHGIIALHPSGIHGKLEAGAPVVVGVDHDLDLVTADADVTARQELLDAVGMAIERAHEHVKVVLVVGNLRFRRKARVRVLGRLELAKLPNDRGEPPDLVVVLPVDDRRGRRPVRNSGGRRVGRRR